MKHLLLFSLLCLMFVSCKTENAHEEEEAASTKQKVVSVKTPDRVLNVGFVIVNGVYNSELIAPMDIFHHTVFHTTYGMQVFTIAPSKEVITTFEGLRILPDYSFDEEELPNIDVLVVPSAENSMSGDLENTELIQFVNENGNKALFIMSLCDGAFVLAKAGLVDDHISTTFPSDIENYRSMFPQLDVKENVSFVHDRKLITSAGGAKSYDPALYLSEIIYGKKAAEGIAAGLVIDWDINQISFITE